MENTIKYHFIGHLGLISLDGLETELNQYGQEFEVTPEQDALLARNLPRLTVEEFEQIFTDKEELKKYSTPAALMTAPGDFHTKRRTALDLFVSKVAAEQSKAKKTPKVESQ